jgi:hypothetical protein
MYKCSGSPQSNAAQHSVHPTGGSLRVFGQFVWLEVGSVKMASSAPAEPPVTQAVGCGCMPEFVMLRHLVFYKKFDKEHA